MKLQRTYRPALTLLLGCTLLLAACGGATGNTTAPTKAASAATSGLIAPPANLIKPGVLTIGSDTTYPPQEFIDPTSKQAIGFDIDIAREIARRMGLTLEVKTTGFDTLLDNLTNRRFDIGISAFTITADRQKKVDFVPYFNAGQSILVAKGNPLNIKSLDDLSGKHVAVQDGTTELDTLKAEDAKLKKANKPGIQILSFKDDTDVVAQLGNSRVQAIMEDSPVAAYYQKNKPAAFEVAGEIIDSAPEGIAVRKGDTQVFTAITKALAAMRADGTYEKILQRWNVQAGKL